MSTCTAVACGASMMPPASSIRAIAARPVARPLASQAAPSTSSVYVSAAATCTTSGVRLCTVSTSMYSGSSVV